MNYNQNQRTAQASNLFPSLWGSPEEYEQAVSSCLNRVFLRMFAALLVTALASFTVVSTPALLALIFSHQYVFYGVIIAQLILVIGISAGINRMSSGAANFLFFLYAILMGLTLSVILLAFDIEVIGLAFVISAMMFAVMAIFGAVTRKDLSSVGSILIMALFGLIIASVVNLFMRNEIIDFILCYAGVLIFIGLTAYDTQRIKRMLKEAHAASQIEAIKKISVIGALTLYLDFINLFLRVLRILSRRR
jgi:hypothetical protein